MEKGLNLASLHDGYYRTRSTLLYKQFKQLSEQFNTSDVPSVQPKMGLNLI